MAEESPRPTAEDSSEEEGEEAAEAPAIESNKRETASPKDGKAKTPAAASPESKPEENKAPVQASPPPAADKPLLPPPPAFQNAAPAPYTPPAPAFPTTTTGVNIFANDGSFLELFKKKMEQKPAASKEEAATPEDKKPEPDKRRPISFVGKRRGGAKLALKTGMVAKKPKTDDNEVVVQKGGAWAQYMAEVKKYKAHQCSDDDKTRPLVK